MQHIPSLDKQFETGETTDHPSVVYGYREARDRGLDLMILHEFGLYRPEVPAIVESLRRHGIEKVALTHPSSALMGIMWEFVQAGATFEMDLVDTGQEEDKFYRARLLRGFIITVN